MSPSAGSAAADLPPSVKRFNKLRTYGLLHHAVPMSARPHPSSPLPGRSGFFIAVQLHTMFQMAGDGTRQNAASDVAGLTAGAWWGLCHVQAVLPDTKRPKCRLLRTSIEQDEK